MSEPDRPRQIRSNNSIPILIGLASATVLIHLLCRNGYGYFRDELYAIACSKHLAWGYVDQPPFSEFVLAIVERVLGPSMSALRLLPAVCGGLVAFLVGIITRELGGGRFAQVLAATAYIVGGVYLAVADYYSMNCFDHLFWALGIYLLVRILKGGDTRLWLLFGLVAGLGLENKYSMGFLGLGLIVGLALTPARRHFLDKWLWLGGALAVVIFLPHVLWEVHNHFPTAEFIRNATLKKNLPMTPWAFLGQCASIGSPFDASDLARRTRVPFLLARKGRSFKLWDGSFWRCWRFCSALTRSLTISLPRFSSFYQRAVWRLKHFSKRHKWYWPKPVYLTRPSCGGSPTGAAGSSRASGANVDPLPELDRRPGQFGRERPGIAQDSAALR